MCLETPVTRHPRLILKVIETLKWALLRAVLTLTHVFLYYYSKTYTASFSHRESRQSNSGLAKITSHTEAVAAQVVRSRSTDPSLSDAFNSRRPLNPDSYGQLTQR